MNYNYIVVEGAIGSGKTALARKLSQYFAARFISENSEAAENPFLMPYYFNTSRHALALQLHYLEERSRLLENIRTEEARSGRVVCDFLLEKDQIYAPVVITDENERRLYWKIRRKILPAIIRPDVAVYLQYSENAENARLDSRQKNERNIFPAGFLSRIKKEYDHFFYLYNEVPLIIANIDELDFTGNDEHFAMLLHTLDTMQGKRHYLNLSE